MRSTLCAVNFLRPLHPLRRLLAVSLVGLPALVGPIGCAASPSSPPPAAAVAPDNAATTETSVTITDPGPEDLLAADPVAALGRRIDQFVQTVQPGMATAPDTPPEPHVSPPAGPSATAPATGTHTEVRSDVQPLDAFQAAPDVLPADIPVAEPVTPPAAIEEAEPADEAIEPDNPLRRRLEERLQTHPGALASVFDYQLLRLIENDLGNPATQAGSPQLAADPGRAPADLASLDLNAEDEAILRTVAEGLAGFRERLTAVTPRNRPLPSEKIAPLLEMIRELQRQAGLELPVIALCNDVRKFGDYDLLPTEFPLANPREVVLYVEVDRFASERLAEGVWETRLSMRTVLYDQDGNRVFEIPMANAVDRSHQRRRDFFLRQIMTLPPIEEAGQYTMKVTVRDMLSNRIAQQSLPLTFGGEATR